MYKPTFSFPMEMDPWWEFFQTLSEVEIVALKTAFQLTQSDKIE